MKTPPKLDSDISTAKTDFVRIGLRQRRLTSASILNRYGTEITLASILLVLCVALSIATPVFLTAENLSNLVKQSAINGIIALGMTIVIITGGIDLSVGSLAGFAGVVVGLLITSGVTPFLSILAALVVSFVIGLLNAFMIHEGGIAPSSQRSAR